MTSQLIIISKLSTTDSYRARGVLCYVEKKINVTEFNTNNETADSLFLNLKFQTVQSIISLILGLKNFHIGFKIQSRFRSYACIKAVCFVINFFFQVDNYY